MKSEGITGDSKYVAKYGHLAKYGSLLHVVTWTCLDIYVERCSSPYRLYIDVYLQCNL